jgi:RHS repeat-associated protein
MLVPRRHGSLESYKYGFQGQEKDDELKGEGNSLNYTFRMHDPRVGRFFAVDPLTKKYPHYTPYSFSGNKVIEYVELEGQEEVKAVLSRNDLFSYFEFDIDTQKGKILNITKGTSVFAVIDVNESDLEDKIYAIKLPSTPKSDMAKIGQNMSGGTPVPLAKMLLGNKHVKDYLLGAESEIYKGLLAFKDVLNSDEATKDYSSLFVGSIALVTKQIYNDLETGKAKIYVKGAPDAYKYVENSKGKKENTLYSEGYTFTIQYNGDGGNLSLQFTIYGSIKTVTEIINEKKKQSTNTQNKKSNQTNNKKVKESDVKVDPATEDLF